MKQYLKKLSYFVAAFAAIICIIILIPHVVLHRVSLKFDPSRNILVIGDSHTEFSINHDILTRCQNVSSSSTTYSFSYAKIKQIVAQNPQIDTILLSTYPGILDMHDLEPDRNESFFARVTDFIFYISPQDIAPFNSGVDYYMTVVKASAKSLVKLSPKTFRDSQIDKLGRYAYTDRMQLDVDIKRLADTPAIRAEIDTASLQYKVVRKISTFCNEHNIKLILFNCPSYNVDRYNDRVHTDSVRMAIMPDIDYMDFSDFPLSEECFSDIDHLNSEGARIFSTYLRDHGFTWSYR